MNLAETCKMLKVFYFKVTTSNNKRHRYTSLLCYDNTHSDPHVSLAQTMNESKREELMKVEVSNENGEHVKAKVEVTYLSLSEDKDFASEVISRESLFLIVANTKYGQTVKINNRYIT